MKRKYSISLNVGFYPEKEMLRLQEKKRQGWQFLKMNRLGILSFQACEPSEKLFAVDFFTGKPAEVAEYLEFYEASGWKAISSYRHKYFYFMADPGTPLIFSDQKSYQERIFAEWRWLLRQSFWVALIGTLLLLGSLIGKNLFDWGWGEYLMIIGGVLLLYPFSYGVAMLFMQIQYRNRAAFFHQPERLAKRQRLGRDMLVLMGIGGVIGGIIGFAVGNFY